MITSDIAIGSVVKNIYRDSYFFDRTGTIVDKDESFFSVQYYDDGSFGPESYKWYLHADRFELKSIEKYRQATVKDLVVGAKIRGNDFCFLGHKTGTLISIRPHSIPGSVGVYYGIKWDDNSTDSSSWFYSPTAFARHFEVLYMSAKKRKPKKIIPDIPLDPTLPILEAGYLQDRMRKQFR